MRCGADGRLPAAAAPAVRAGVGAAVLHGGQRSPHRPGLGAGPRRTTASCGYAKSVKDQSKFRIALSTPCLCVIVNMAPECGHPDNNGTALAPRQRTMLSK